MVVNKLQRGTSWDSYTRSHNLNGTSNSDWFFTSRSNENDAVTITEPLVEWKNTFNMRQITLENIVESINDSDIGTKMSVKAAKMHGRNVVNGAKSLDLLRQNIQSAINNEIDRVIKKYLDIYFVPAINNIRVNLGQGSVNEEHVRELCRTMLDEAKHLYLNSPLARSDSPFNTPSDTGTLIESRFGNSQDDLDEDKRLCMLIKRRECGNVNTASMSQLPIQKRKSIISIAPRVPLNDPAKITPRTLFIMSSRVTKVLGCGGLRGRLFLRHPDLFRYCIDTEDREWLSKHKLHYVSSQSTSPSHMMILQDVLELLNLDCYRNSASVMRAELKGFEVPEFMLKKVRLAITAGKTFVPKSTTVENKTKNPDVINVSNAVPVECSSTETVQMETSSTNGVIQPTNVLIQVKEKKKVPKSNWTEDAMQKALRLIQRGRSQRYVERKFGIPRRTLRNRLKIAASVRKTNSVL